MKSKVEEEGAHMSPQGTSPQSTDNTLYKRMTIVTHTVIFLYSAAFWIQVGVLPVSGV